MDYGFSEEQEMFRRSVRDFMEKECPRTLVREIEKSDADYSRELYRKMAGLDWLGLLIPEDYGGVGGTWVDLAILCEEAGRALLQSPYIPTIVLAGQTIFTFGSEEQRQSFLPRIAAGDIIMTLALTEPDAEDNLELLATAAVAEGDGFVLSGTKLFIPFAHVVDYIITVARTAQGLALFLVEAQSNGLTCTSLDTLAGRLSEVVFDRVRVPASSMLGGPGDLGAIADIVDKAKLMHCAEMVGGAQVALDMAIEYSKDRVQFDRPIGSFQALQHKMVNMTVAIEGARWLVYYTAWMLSEGIPCAAEMAMAQLTAGEAYRFVASEAGQVHGGMGMMTEHDWGLFFRRAKAAQLNLGPWYSKLETIASSLGI